MVKLGSSELGSRFSNNRDVISAKILADRLRELGQLEKADKIMTIQNNYLTAWNGVLTQLNTFNPIAFPLKVYDSAVNRWRDSVTNRFVKAPFEDDAYRNQAVQLRLIEE